MTVRGQGGSSAEADTSNELVVESLADQLYRILLRRIIDGQLAPGSRIDIPALAREFGTSKTPIREALNKLEFDHFVITKQRSGSYVRQPTIADVDEICQLRMAIEWLCTGLAAETMAEETLRSLRDEVQQAERIARDTGDFRAFFQSDANLHGAIIAETHNDRIIQVRKASEPFLQWIRVLGATGIHRIEVSTQRHLEIIDAMLARDVERSRNLATVHVDEVQRFTKEDFSGQFVDFAEARRHITVT